MTFDHTQSFPAREGLRQNTEWYWQCAYADCAATPNVLPSYLFVRLANYDRFDRRYARKYYTSANAAVSDLETATEIHEKLK